MKQLNHFMARCLLLSAIVLGGLTAKAESVEGLFVVSDDLEQSFAISEVKELTFADDCLKVVRNDNTETSFEGNWSFHFGAMASTGTQMTVTATPEGPVQVYSPAGMLVLSAPSM